MTITPSNNESKGAPTRKNFITPQDCKLIVDQVRDDANAHLAMLTGTVSLKVCLIYLVFYRQVRKTSVCTYEIYRLNFFKHFAET